MEEEEIITLEDNKDYLVLLENTLVEGDYMLAVELDKNEEYTKNFKVFKKEIEEDNEYVEEVDDEELLSKLLVDFELQYKDLAEEILEEEGIDLSTTWEDEKKIGKE